MPELINFDKIAKKIAKVHANRTDEDGEGNIVEISASEDDLTADIAAQLRQVWNARGAADADLFADEMDHRDISERIATLDSAPIAKA